jgi:hypothetical protein
MDRKQLVTWATLAVARGLAWVFAAKLGLDATEAEGVASAMANGLAAIALAGLSLWSSVRDRRKLSDGK